MRATIYMRSGNQIHLRHVKKIETARDPEGSGLSRLTWELKGGRQKLHTIDVERIEAIVIERNWRGK